MLLDDRLKLINTYFMLVETFFFWGGADEGGVKGAGREFSFNRCIPMS